MSNQEYSFEGQYRALSERETLLRIRRAEEEIRRICQTTENKRRLSYWDDAEISSDYFRAIPKDKGVKPFCVELERPQQAKLQGYDFYEFYHNPYLHYLSGLEMQIYKFMHFDDCTPVVKRVPVYPSGAFERSIFVGDDAKYTEHDAVISHECVIEDGRNFDDMAYPDFYTSGRMPEIIELYEAVRKVAAEDFAVGFPEWGRSAWGCAWQMRRLENLMLDLSDEPEWVDRMLLFFNEARKRWAKQKFEYLGLPLAPSDIYNDEVLNPIVGPKLYEEKILPLEIDTAKFFGGVTYWHSCGDTSKLLHLINRIPNVKLITVSAWTDVVLAGKTYDKDRCLEVQLHNSRDVLDPARDADVQERLELVRDATANHRSYLLAGGLVFFKGFDDGMRRVRELCDKAHRVLNV